MKNIKKGPFSGRKTIKAYFEASEGEGLLPELISSTVEDWQREKHRGATAEEIRMINGAKPESCPLCGSARFVSKGKRKDGVARFLCRLCGKTFSPLTGTLFDSKRIPISEWVEFLVNLCAYESVSQSAMTNMNAQSTGGYWLKKVFAAIEGCQSGVVLKGDVYVDETYFAETPCGMAMLPSGKAPRGLSKNLWCVCTARDGEGGFCLFACGKGKPSGKRILDSLSGHIERGSSIIHDGDSSHSALVKGLGLASEVHTTAETKGLEDAENPMEPINELHRYLKKFMSRHGGYKRCGLQDWLNLFYMVFSSFGDPSVFVARVLRMMLNCRKIIRYREAMGKKIR